MSRKADQFLCCGEDPYRWATLARIRELRGFAEVTQDGLTCRAPHGIEA